MDWRWVTSAERITQRPSKLRGLVVTPSAATASLTVYDGEGTGDPTILHVALATANTRTIRLADGLKTNRGLFIGNFTNVTGVLVLWEALER